MNQTSRKFGGRFGIRGPTQVPKCCRNLLLTLSFVAFHGPLAKNYSLYVIEYLDFTEAESARQIPCFRAFRAASFTNLKHGVNET